MLVFVIGGSGSGKSEWAERKALEISGSGKALYAATMRNDGTEAAKRIKRHREARTGKNFITAEPAFDLRELSAHADDGVDTVLIEDLSNLLTNLRYYKNLTFEEAENEIREQIQEISAIFGNIVIVSNDVFSDGLVYDEETIGFIKSLSLLNREFAAKADIFMEVVVGIPLIKWKSENENY